MAVSDLRVEPAEKRQRCDDVVSAATYAAGTAERQAEVPAAGTLRVVASVSDATCPVITADKARANGIVTGIAFLDHMVDQLVSHGQLAISVQTWIAGRALEKHSNEMRQIEADAELVKLVGGAVGSAMKAMLAPALCTNGTSASRKFSFSAPLDEAFVDCTIEFLPEGAGIAEVSLAPYGIYPKGGRKAIGSFRTHLTTDFFAQLAESLGCKLSVKKVRGDNAHHIVESTFKSFGRCVRSAMDSLASPDGLGPRAVVLQPRVAQQKRSTKETSIEVSVNLDPSSSEAIVCEAISTGIKTLDAMLLDIRVNSGMSLGVRCTGDLWIDEHHSAEDVMITVGKVLSEALGDRGGLNRMGCATAACGNANVKCVMDLSNRPSFCSDLRLQDTDEDIVGDLPAEMIYHGFESLVMNSLITVHFAQTVSGDGAFSAGDVTTAAARAFGSALRQCASIDPRRAGAPASSKGTLST